MNQRTNVDRVQQAGRDAQFADDEINLFDLFKDIKENFHWLFGITMCFAILGVVYALMVTPVFKVETRIKEPLVRYLSELNAPELAGVYSLNVDNAYNQAKQALYSQEYLRGFHTQNIARLKVSGLYQDELAQSQNFQKFIESLTVNPSNDKKDNEKFVLLSLELSDPVLATDLLNEYVEYALNRRMVEIKETIESNKKTLLRKLEYDASSLRNEYFDDKIQRKLKLNEAQQIAKSVGQLDPVYSKSDILGSFTPPLYMYGLKALNAEEVALDSREKIAAGLPHGEEHFIGGLSKILFSIKKLDDIDIDYSSVKLALVDEPALEPLLPIKPKKTLIVILATIAGGFIGLMLALVLAAYKRYKLEK